jgi:hypothetical protein
MQVLGTRIQSVIAEYRAWRRGQPMSHVPDVLNRKTGATRRHSQASPLALLVIQVVVSLAVLLLAAVILLGGGHAADSQKWAFGIVGVVVGYWLS